MPETLWLPGELKAEIQLDGARTNRALFMFVDHPPAGWALPPHRHRTEAETIHIRKFGMAAPDAPYDQAAALAAAARHGWEFV